MAVDELGEWTGGRTAVPAISRAAMILAALDAAPEPPTFGDLARLAPLPRSSLHNLCSRLVDAGLLQLVHRYPHPLRMAPGVSENYTMVNPVDHGA